MRRTNAFLIQSKMASTMTMRPMFLFQESLLSNDGSDNDNNDIETNVFHPIDDDNDIDNDPNVSLSTSLVWPLKAIQAQFCFPHSSLAESFPSAIDWF